MDELGYFEPLYVVDYEEDDNIWQYLIQSHFFL